MKLKIGSLEYNHFTGYAVSLKYDSVASVFSFKTRFNKDSEAQRKLFKPLSFNNVILYQDDEVLLTGVSLNSKSKATSIDSDLSISGYSKTGVIEDCEIPVELYPLQSDNLSLKEIAKKLINPFGLNLVVDPSVQSIVNKVYAKSTANPKSSIKSYLSELAFQRGVIITHNEKGELLFTKANFNSKPIARFSESMPSVEIDLDVNGQNMHSTTTVIKQASADGGNAGQSKVNNSLISEYRPTTKIQTSGTDIDTIDVAKTMRSTQLKSIKLTIKVDRNQWLVNNKKQLIRPDNTILVNSPTNFIFKDALFFVEGVSYSGDETQDIAVLSCVLPEVYSNLDPINIFE